jgi:mRNA interferase MazF
VPFEGALQRGDIVLVSLDPVRGSEQGGNRPALVVSPELINRNSPVVLVAAITSKKTDRIYPFEVLIDAAGVLAQRSKAMLMQMRAVDRSRIVSRVGRLDASAMPGVDRAVRIATGLESL